MDEGESRKDRVRALVFLRAENADETAETIYTNLGKEGKDDYVIIRADVLESVEDDFNIVVPIDTAPEHFTSTKNLVTEYVGEENSKTFVIKNHYPPPTYQAHGYTTTEEFAKEMGWDRPEEWTRVPNSPGDNPWG